MSASELTPRGRRGVITPSRDTQEIGERGNYDPSPEHHYPAPTFPSPNPAGRPLTYNERIAATICKHLRHATSRHHAYRAAGITYETFEQWLQVIPGFAERIAKAESDMIVSVSQSVYTAAIDVANAKGDPKIGVEILKRRDRQAWGDAIDLRKIDTADLVKIMELQQDNDLIVQAADPGDEAI